MSRRPWKLAGIVLLSLAVLSAGYAVAPDSAKAVTTSYLYKQIKYIKSAISSIKSVNTTQSSRITDLRTRMAQAEATGTALMAWKKSGGTVAGPQGPSGPTGPEGARGPSGGAPDGFWPERAVSVSVPILAVHHPETAEQPSEYWELIASLEPTAVDAATGQTVEIKPSAATLKFTVAGDVYQGDEQRVAATFDMLPFASGTPIPVEWWFEYHGQFYHAAQTITDWAWQDY